MTADSGPQSSVGNSTPRSDELAATPATPANRTGKPPSLRDVAEAAFVSVSTASMALNGHAAVAADTRTRVEAAAKALNYRPDSTARALRAGSRMASVGVYVQQTLTEDFDQFSRLFTHRLMRLLTDTLTRPDVILHQVTDLADPRNEDLSVLVVVGDQSIDPELAKRLARTRIITAGHRGPSEKVVASVTHDQEKIASDLVDHFRSNGATELCVVRFQEAVNYSEIGSVAVIEAATAAGISAGQRTVGFDPAETTAACQEAVEAGADALFVMLPFPGAALTGIRAAGAQVPRDVLLVGRGEGTLEAQTSPTTSSMSMMAVQTGALIVEVVDRVLQGESDVHLTAPHRLIVRESSVRQ